MEDLISIIVPVYNVEKYLDMCIESIVNQTYQNLEIILIDDGSTDYSGKKCDEWADKDNRIKVIHKENSGVSSARNLGLNNAMGKYIAFVDADDYLQKDMYQIMYREIKKENINFVICDINVVNNNISNGAETEKYCSELINKFQAIQMFYPLAGGIWKCLFIKDKLKKFNFDTTLQFGEDLKFICEYIMDSDNDSLFVYINKKLYNYISRENSATKKYFNLIDVIKDIKLMIIEKCKDISIISKIEKSTIIVYWVTIYSLLNKKLVTNNELIKKYYNELKEYKQYFSKKDKFYMMLLGINPKLFEFVYKNVKRKKRLLKKR